MESTDGIRRRTKDVNEDNGDLEEPKKTENTKEKTPKQKLPRINLSIHLETGSYWLTRIVFLRALAFIYFVAFLVAAQQNKQLLGNDGLLPARSFLLRISKHFNNTYQAVNAAPTLFWFSDWSNLNQLFDIVAWSGMVLSGFILITGASNMIIMFILWVLYHTLVNVGQKWYSFGWESQLLETGFLAIFLCPVIKLQPIPIKTPTPSVVVWGYRWLIFRIMLGAGLIKIRGDQCWRDLTCMNYHYQTQPVPNPMSYYLHQTPELMHKFETSVNHFVELVAPFFLLLTRRFRLWGGAIQIIFQVVLIISGNLSFLNWLTILPSIMCFDDASLGWLFPSTSTAKISVLKIQEEEKEGKKQRPSWGMTVRRISEVMLAVGLAYLSIPVVQNLLSSRQAMNTSFDSLRIVNTYGAFGSITKERTEVIFQGTRNTSVVPDEHGGIWEEYEFVCKPGNIMRRPCVISPYHYRLDWLMWFAAFQNYNHNPWIVHLAAKLLANDNQATSLIAFNPFYNGTPPRYIRAEHYLYEFTKIGSVEANRGQWWTRKRIGNYLPMVRMNELKDFLKNFGWKVPKVKKLKN